jgi:4-diphosphocytidyl-2-C-methyl-D-erythritol kinase
VNPIDPRRSAVSTQLLYRCFAKVNLTLEVLGRRDDGYHDIASLAHTIGLADELRLQPAQQLLTTVEGLDLPAQDNLVVRAAHLLAAETGFVSGARIELRKRIPAAAGLGGGSSDAAATLRGLNRLWGTRAAPALLAHLAAQLGSDVPYFLRGGATVMRGRGESLELLPPSPPTWLVIVAPSYHVFRKTATLYRALRQSDFSDGQATHQAAARLRGGQRLRDGDLVNAFERAARDTFPGLETLWRAAQEATGCSFHLSGAGPALFALAVDRTHARVTAARLAGFRQPVFVARTVRKGHSGAKIPYPYL